MWKYEQSILLNNAWIDRRISARCTIIYTAAGGLEVGKVLSGRRRKSGWIYKVGGSNYVYEREWEMMPHKLMPRPEPQEYCTHIIYPVAEVSQSQIISVYRPYAVTKFFKSEFLPGTVMEVTGAHSDESIVSMVTSSSGSNHYWNVRVEINAPPSIAWRARSPYSGIVAVHRVLSGGTQLPMPSRTFWKCVLPSLVQE